MKETLLWGKNPHRDSRLRQQHQQSWSCSFCWGHHRTHSWDRENSPLPSGASCSEGAGKGFASPSSAAAALGCLCMEGLVIIPLDWGNSTLPGPSAAREQLLPCWVKCPWGTEDLDRLWEIHWFGTELEVPNLGTALQLPLVELKSLGTSHCDIKDSCNWQGKELGSARAVFLEMCCDASSYTHFSWV